MRTPYHAEDIYAGPARTPAEYEAERLRRGEVLSRLVAEPQTNNKPGRYRGLMVVATRDFERLDFATLAEAAQHAGRTANAFRNAINYVKVRGKWKRRAEPHVMIHGWLYRVVAREAKGATV